MRKSNIFILFVLIASCSYIKFEVGKRNEEKMLRNLGVVAALENAKSNTKVDRQSIAEVFGVHIDSTIASREISFEIIEEEEQGEVVCRLGQFMGYDRVQIPFYELLPPEYQSTNRYPVVILFSGHGDMDQIAHGQWSYQKGAGLDLANAGFIVYTMENRGMGMLSDLGDHLKIDAVARLTGGSWYGELLTDGLDLISLVRSLPHTDNRRMGVGGVSTGGALSLLTAAMDAELSAAYVQGYLGSYKTTFGTRSNHHICNNIAGILDHFDMSDIGGSLAPRPAMYVNGERDTFYYQDAQLAFDMIHEVYKEQGAGDNATFAVPEGTVHEMSTDLMLAFFLNHLKP